MRPGFPKSLREPTKSSDWNGQGEQVAQGKLKPRAWGQRRDRGLIIQGSWEHFNTCLKAGRLDRLTDGGEYNVGKGPGVG